MSDPTDLELMMFADGELEEERHREVAEFLDRSRDARLKLKAMGIVGDLVRKDSDRLATACRADDIVTHVLAKVADEEGAPSEANKTTGSPPRVPLAKGQPANDNARFIYGLAALAAAAAFVLWMWGRGSNASGPPGEGPVAQAPTDVATSVAAAPPPTAATVAATTPTAKATAEAESSGEPAVTVASVNWGENKPGTVYYVPKDADGSTTTVVWLAAE